MLQNEPELVILSSWRLRRIQKGRKWKIIGTDVVNPMVSEKIDEALGLPKGVGVFMGILNSPGSPAGTPENKDKGYMAAHKKANELDPRHKDPGKEYSSEHIKQNIKNTDGKKLYTQEELIYINNKTNVRTSVGRFKTNP
ncbi:MULTISPECIES: hypothetical protein [unclassified Chryseobacterium]|uniref:hypothetical protein n=1 Tax=unclassified Chryseobacterium TaxID=2593645 RepID=UPI00100A9636|nr:MULTISPECIES: hypothetical protein [unclassified Chryseobacterium]RXM50312.1 hypothetical protein BOQ64_19715 [Chryseobacterium sp. CH25]RXM62497.1 hypothetical protein BOQ60_20510 [Chryseobacterium sp. CH1]